MEKGFVYDYLAGIEFPGFGSIYFGRIPLIPLGRWLMGVAVIFFIAGIYLNRRRQILLFEMVRFGGRKRWWNAQFWDLFPAAAAGCFGYAGTGGNIDPALVVGSYDDIDKYILSA